MSASKKSIFLCGVAGAAFALSDVVIYGKARMFDWMFGTSPGNGPVAKPGTPLISFSGPETDVKEKQEASPQWPYPPRKS